MTHPEVIEGLTRSLDQAVINTALDLIRESRAIREIPNGHMFIFVHVHNPHGMFKVVRKEFRDGYMDHVVIQRVAQYSIPEMAWIADDQASEEICNPHAFGRTPIG